MYAKVRMIVVVLLLSGALAGCPSPTDVADNVTTPSTSASDDSSSSAETPADQPAGGGSDAADGGSSTPDDGSSASDPPQDNGSAGDDSSDDGSQDTGDDPGGGDPGGDDPGGGDPDGGNGPPVFRGTYSGQVDCRKSESLMGRPGPERDWTQPFSITFDANGLPTAFVIPGYMQAEGGIEFVAQVNQVGESVTLNESRGTYDATLTVTVAVATYNETDARIVLSLVHYGEQGSLTQEGTGMHIVQYELDGSNLTYSSLTTYEVMLSGQFDTTWDIERVGTLAPQ